MGCALKNLFLKPRLRGGVSQLLSHRLAAAELCNKMLFVGAAAAAAAVAAEKLQENCRVCFVSPE